MGLGTKIGDPERAYWPLFCVIVPNSVNLEVSYVKVVEERPLLFAAVISPKNLFLQYSQRFLTTYCKTLFFRRILICDFLI